MKYYGLFVKMESGWERLQPTKSYTLETAKRVFAPLILQLLFNNVQYALRPLPPVKPIDVRGPDKKYASTPWR